MRRKQNWQPRFRRWCQWSQKEEGLFSVVLSSTLSYSSRSSSSFPPKEWRTGWGRSNKLNFSYPFVIQHDKEDGEVKKRWNTHLIPLLMSSCCCVVFVPLLQSPFFSVPDIVLLHDFICCSSSMKGILKKMTITRKTGENPLYGQQ